MLFRAIRGIIALATDLIALGCASCNYLAVAHAIIPELHSKASDYLYILHTELLH